MFRRNVGGSAGYGLPMALQTKGGDGRSIRMDAPIVRTIKQADTSTKATYTWLFVSLLLMWFGWRHCLHHTSSTVLRCDMMGCMLQDRKAKSKSFTKIMIPRNALIKTELACVDKAGNLLFLYFADRESEANCLGRRGFYSYTLVYDANKMTDSKQDNIESLQTHVMRKYNLSKARNRSEFNKLSSYIKGMSQSIDIKHEQLVTWQGLVLATIGLLSLTMCALFGQFSDPRPARKPARKKLPRKGA